MNFNELNNKVMTSNFIVVMSKSKKQLGKEVLFGHGMVITRRGLQTRRELAKKDNRKRRRLLINSVT